MTDAATHSQSLVDPNERSFVAPPEPAPAEFLNRELMWLQFNRRVLHQALDARTPLLERVRFLGIFTSNLDEFIMKRLASIKRQAAAGVVSAGPDGMTAQQVADELRRCIVELQRLQSDCYLNEIRPALAAEGIHLASWAQLTPEEQTEASAMFMRDVFPQVTPLAVDPGHPFPFISNLSESLGVVLRHSGRDDVVFARVKIPEMVPRWVRLKCTEKEGYMRFASLYEVVAHNLDDLFPGMHVLAVMPFRVTRNADVERDAEDADDLRELIEQELKDRRFAKAVRLEHGPDPNPWMLQFLKKELELGDDDVYEVGGELDYGDLRPIADLNIPRLRYEPWTPLTPPPLRDKDADFFALIRQHDLLVHHPYESFNASVERFVKQAAQDPKVLAIKTTIYRAGDDNPFIYSLIQAAEARKHVVCIVEIKARFDEERNIELARSLEDAGVHVVFGVVGLKTHTKTTLVVREDPDRIRCYAHIGTGNYHAGTAKLYTDLGLFTADPGITGDLVDLFHFLTGRSLKRDYAKLLIAPACMRDRFMAMIERETEHARAGRPARIIAKMNSLEEHRICRALYAASNAGVQIDLIVRGFCCLRPGVKNLSENIRVSSVIGRFLEHSRIFYFRNGQQDELAGDFFIGSADWMYRNLLARVEAVVPIESAANRQRLWEILQIMLADGRQTWDMASDGTYSQRTPRDAEDIGTHAMLMYLNRERERSLRALPGRATAR